MGLVSRDAKRLGRMAALQTMWVAVLVSWCLVQVVGGAGGQHGPVDVDDNEFAEFEEFDEPSSEELTGTKSPNLRQSPPPGGGEAEAEEPEVAEEEEEVAEPPRRRSAEPDDDEFGIIEEDEDGFVVAEDEFAHLRNSDEFEGYEEAGGGVKAPAAAGGEGGAGPLKFADVPSHLRNNWSNYQVELLMLIGLGAYLANYAWGRARNSAIASAWVVAHRELLESQFAMVGDDGLSSEPPSEAQDSLDSSKLLLRDTDSSFNVWCSGRAGVDGMLVTLRLLKRQDLVSLIATLMRPKLDQIVVKVDLEAGEMDSFVFAIGCRKSIAKIGKEMTDLSQYCAEKKNSTNLGLPSSFSLLSESMEATTAMIDPKILTILEKFEECIDFIHFSDQFCGPKPQDGETCTKLPDVTRALIFSFNIPKKLKGGMLGSSADVEEMESLKPLLSLVFYCVEKVRRFRLSREGKLKADRNRQAAAETFLKTTHSQRQEAAQQRREDRVRERKERLMAEEDPDKQRRLEIMEKKREAKKKTPKMKQLKIKAM